MDHVRRGVTRRQRTRPKALCEPRRREEMRPAYHRSPEELDAGKPYDGRHKTKDLLSLLGWIRALGWALERMVQI